jgi:hypothetical protein
VVLDVEGALEVQPRAKTTGISNRTRFIGSPFAHATVR